MIEHTFTAMGCTVVVAGASTAEQRAVERLFGEREGIFSRFLPGSELNRVNRAAGRLVRVSPLFADTLAIALRIAEQTGGLVDPTLGGALVSAGYTCDFALLAPDPRPVGPARPGAWHAVLLTGDRIRVPAGVALDLNGVVKALAVDDALALLSGDGYVSAGGDVAARGELTVELPDGEPVGLRHGALATSGTVKRRWLRGGELQHHLIDPQTGCPSDSRWEQVTACGASCLAADAAAKAGFLLDERGPDWLDGHGIPARFLAVEGVAVTNEAWRRSLTDAQVVAPGNTAPLRVAANASHAVVLSRPHTSGYAASLRPRSARFSPANQHRTSRRDH